MTGLFKIYSRSNIDLGKKVCRKEVKQQCSPPLSPMEVHIHLEKLSYCVLRRREEG